MQLFMEVPLQVTSTTVPSRPPLHLRLYSSPTIPPPPSPTFLSRCDPRPLHIVSDPSTPPLPPLHVTPPPYTLPSTCSNQSTSSSSFPLPYILLLSSQESPVCSFSGVPLLLLFCRFSPTFSTPFSSSQYPLLMMMSVGSSRIPYRYPPPSISPLRRLFSPPSSNPLSLPPPLLPFCVYVCVCVGQRTRARVKTIRAEHNKLSS